ncbi:LOW QUALITY PROTEIN: hypothetical protein HID58_022864 [Brassica napus]|uniref:Pectinesterase inhibitor domain-containing protein n=1 Tax=Brassica napus TaxID=3708 RepID=A0ABQ8D0G0_BRANA|nr:LOW QUALITY PROTEIN: hypothetical protein HID58_022864 [Brassica napus]
MAKLNQTFFLILSICYFLSPALTAATTALRAGASNKAVNFIQTSCKTTTYPAVCFHSLSAYANAIQTSPKRLAETALAVTLSRAQSTKLFVSRLTRFKGLKKREIEAIKDCVEEINDTIDRLTKSVQEMKLCGSAKNQEQFAFHMSNAQTWTSAALTDENTCSDGFSGRVMDGRIKNSVRARIVNVGHETSNALSLINAFAKNMQNTIFYASGLIQCKTDLIQASTGMSLGSLPFRGPVNSMKLSLTNCEPLIHQIKTKFNHHFLASLLITITITTLKSVHTTTTTNTEFVKSLCTFTTYPRLCVTSLSTQSSLIQTSHKLMAHAALNITLASAKATSAMMVRVSSSSRLKPREVSAMRDCVEELGDTLEELRKSLGEMGQLSGSNYEVYMNDIQTWVSAALTDEYTCSDGFEGDEMNGKVKVLVRGRILIIAHLTSNALALINHFASIHC